MRESCTAFMNNKKIHIQNHSEYFRSRFGSRLLVQGILDDTPLSSLCCTVLPQKHPRTHGNPLPLGCAGCTFWYFSTSGPKIYTDILSNRGSGTPCSVQCVLECSFIHEVPNGLRHCDSQPNPQRKRCTASNPSLCKHIESVNHTIS